MGSCFADHYVGTDQFLACDSADHNFLAAFEDDGQTGYFYGARMSETVKGKFEILDALHVYNVASVTDKDEVCRVEVRWARDGRHKAGLFIESYCHAVFDFDEKRAGCRSGFPPADGKFTNAHGWDDELLKGLEQTNA